MKVYISADMEGVTGVANWDEVDKSKPDYAEFRQAMTREVAATCEAVISAGAQEVVVKDAHWTGRNILLDQLPDKVRVIRGWSGHPLSMVQEIDSTFSAALFVGYHSRAGASGNPLAHTMRSGTFARIQINDRWASEFLLHGYAAALFKVPVCLVSGDQGLLDEVKSINENIATVASGQGIGASTVSRHPRDVLSEIKAKAVAALKADLAKCVLDLPKNFQVKVQFKDHMKAYRGSFYPQAKLLDEMTVGFETKDYFEVMRLISFM